LGDGKVAPKVENAIRTHLKAGNGILKVARIVGCGSGTVQRVKREMAMEVARAIKIVTATRSSLLSADRLSCETTHEVSRFDESMVKRFK